MKLFTMAALGAASVMASFVAPLSASAQAIITNPGRYDGARLNVQTQRGSSCSSTAPDRSHFSVTAGHRNYNYDNVRYNGNYYGGNDSGEFVGGVVLTIPFGGPNFGDCSNLLELEEARAQLDMATTLFEAGAMTAEELKEVADRTKAVIAAQQD